MQRKAIWYIYLLSYCEPTLSHIPWIATTAMHPSKYCSSIVKYSVARKVIFLPYCIVHQILKFSLQFSCFLSNLSHLSRLTGLYIIYGFSPCIFLISIYYNIFMLTAEWATNGSHQGREILYLYYSNLCTQRAIHLKLKGYINIE